MKPTDNQSGGHSRSGDYGFFFPAGSLNQKQGEEDLMSSLFMLPDSQSPPLSPLLLPLPLAEGFAWQENFSGPQFSPLIEMPSIPVGDDGGQISPLDEMLSRTDPAAVAEEMPCIPFVDGQSSPLDEMLPCIPTAVVAQETNYGAAPPTLLVAMPGTGAGQFSSNFLLSPTTSDQFDDEEVRQTMVSWQHCLHPAMAPDGLSNTTYGGPAAASHVVDALPPVVQQDELPRPQQQLPLPTNDPEARPGDGWAWPDLSLANKEVQIQQMTPTISPSQPPSPTPVINPGPDEANHAASTPMGWQGTKVSMASKSITPPAAPQDQEANILSRASTRRRAKSRGLPSQLQDGSVNLLVMGMDMVCQLGRYIGKMMEEEKHRSIVCWQHFWRSQCKYCSNLNMICKYCNTVMRYPMGYPSTIQLLRHLERCDNYIHLLPASSRASKETQRSSQALQIKEIVENPNGESEPIETDNSNCATATQVDTQGINAVVLSPRPPHQVLMDREEQIATILSSQPCCQGRRRDHSLDLAKNPVGKPLPWWDLIIRVSDSSYCSSTTESTHDGFRLKFYNDNKETGCKIDHVHSSAAWMHVSENPYKDHGGISLETASSIIGSSHLWLGISICDHVSASLLPGFAYPWHRMHLMLRSLGFRKEFATIFVIYALGWIDRSNLMVRSPSSSNKGKSIVAQGDVPSGKRKRKPLPPRSKVWKHFTKELVEAEGSMVTMARCIHCGSELKAGSASHGTTHLARHITSKHPEHAESL